MLKNKKRANGKLAIGCFFGLFLLFWRCETISKMKKERNVCITG